MGRKDSRSGKDEEAAIDRILETVCEEFAGELEVLRAQYIEDYAPVTDEERMRLEILARGQWQQRCLDRVETRIWNEEMEKAEDAENALGEAWCNRSADFMRLQRRMDAAQRSYYKALHEWERLRDARKIVRTRAKPAPAIKLADLPSASRWRM